MHIIGGYNAERCFVAISYRIYLMTGQRTVEIEFPVVIHMTERHYIRIAVVPAVTPASTDSHSVFDSCWRKRLICLNSMTYKTIFSPTIDETKVKMKNSLGKVAGSWKNNMPTDTVPIAPIPVHTA